MNDYVDNNRAYPYRQWIGWKNDVLQLAKANSFYPIKYQNCLFEQVMPLQRWYVEALNNKKIAQQKELNKEHKDRQSLTSSKLKLLILEKYRSELDKIRNLHYASIEAQYETLINEKRWLINPKEANRKRKKNQTKAVDYLIQSDDDGDFNQYFSEQNVLKFKHRRFALITLLCIYMLTFWICFVRIYWTADFFERVALGITVFDEQNIKWYDWAFFAIFLVAWACYNHYAIWESIKNSGKQMLFLVTCCRINKDIESRFETPFFDPTKYDEHGNLNVAPSSPHSHSSLPETISKKLYIQDHQSQQDDGKNNDNDDDEDEDEDDAVHDVGF